MELLDILDKLAKETELANVDLTSKPATVRPSWESRKRQAQDRADRLRVLYAQTLFDQATGLFLAGDAGTIKGIGELIESYKTGVAVHAQQLYLDLADKIEPLFGPNRLWLVDMTQKLNFLLGKTMRDLGAGVGYVLVAPQNPSFAVKDKDELVRLIRSWIMKALGVTPSLYYLCRQIRDKALTIGLTAESYVVVGNIQEDELMEWAKLFKKPSGYEKVTGEPKDALTSVLQKYQRDLKTAARKPPKKITGRE